ncbi:MAG TPA: alpha/beta hydrolase [Anaerolineae bacterium]|nr:alpha/beta hydrolase [Anaerolineae bacterium]
MKRWFWRIFVLVDLVILLVVGGFVFWAQNTAPLETEAEAALWGTDMVDVVDGEWLIFQPRVGEVTTGFIIYPGGRVDYRAYAPLAQDVAAEGYLAVIVPMPLNLAVFDSLAAAQVVAAFPNIEHWVIGGHSLGGAMAAQYTVENQNLMDGLVLWASYPAGSADLSGWDGEVVSIYGTRDGVAAVEDVLAGEALLPESAVFVPIEGGNHAQFGWYGSQSGDLEAEIAHEEQRALTVAATLELLAQVEE